MWIDGISTRVPITVYYTSVVKASLRLCVDHDAFKLSLAAFWWSSIPFLELPLRLYCFFATHVITTQIVLNLSAPQCPTKCDPLRRLHGEGKKERKKEKVATPKKTSKVIDRITNAWEIKRKRKRCAPFVDNFSASSSFHRSSFILLPPPPRAAACRRSLLFPIPAPFQRSSYNWLNRFVQCPVSGSRTTPTLSNSAMQQQDTIPSPEHERQTRNPSKEERKKRQRQHNWFSSTSNATPVSLPNASTTTNQEILSTSEQQQ